MTRPFKPLPGIAAALLLAACAAAPVSEERLAVRPPTSEGTASLATKSSPAQIAEALRARGFTDVAVLRDGSVRLRSGNPALIDCGTLVQVVMGNRAEFPATSGKAVLLAKRPADDPLVRTVTTRSEIRLRPLSSGDGYAIDETHRVKLRYASLKSGRSSTTSVSFGATDSAKLADHTTCRSSGLIGKILG